jgi:hypothetical protein
MSADIRRLKNEDGLAGEKAALKRPHSKRWRATLDASSLAERLECGRFSAAFRARDFAQTPASLTSNPICVYPRLSAVQNSANSF